MQWKLEFQGKPLELILDQATFSQLSQQSSPLFVRMELAIESFPIKKVRFHHDKPLDTPFQAFGNQLYLAYQGLIARHLSKNQKEEPLIWESTSSRLELCKPRWLQLQYRTDTWKGTYGFRLQDMPKHTAPPALPAR